MRRAIVAMVLALALVPGVAHAHSASSYYKMRWKSDLTLGWHFTAGFPGGAYRDKIVYGAGQWNAQNQSLRWSYYPTDYANFSWSPCPTKTYKNAVHWADIPYAGLVRACLYGSDPTRIWSVQMIIDSAGTNWYAGSGTPAANQVDLWSIATHEWGHMSGSLAAGDGKGHFPEADAACPDGALRNSLCPSIPMGTTHMWNTELHDEHTFQSAY